MEQSISSAGDLIEENKIKIDDILKEKLENAFHKKTSNVILTELTKIAIEHSSIDLAYAAIHLPLHVRPILFDNISNFDDKIKFIINTNADTRIVIFRYMKEIDIKNIFDKMPTSEAIWVLEDMSERRFRRVLELINPKKAIEIKEQKKHDRNSAGRLMNLEFFAFNKEKTIEEASLYIHDHLRIDFTKGIYITNEKKELIGFVPARNMIVNQKSAILKQLMRPITHSVKTYSSREEVIDLFERYKLFTLPVVDEDNKILGVISHEDAIEAMEDMADETFAKIAGTTEDVSSSEPIFRRFIKRAPWLFVTLLAGLINVVISSSFQKNEGILLTFVLFFVPLITGMSGNIGIQCSTVLVRSIALGLVSKKSKWDAVTKELLTGFLTGSIFGIICTVMVIVINLFTNFNFNVSPTAIGIITGTGLIGACFTGSLLGVLSPVFFESLGIDPAISSGPIVTALNDILSMTIYFFISYGLSILLF
ncbi:MAG: hypothetical protein A3F40_04275 [Chlamydiae bacterium RIFCSPHIGHO2_12_FULL_27_8]|nr:MAG: hypothetical protein A3F40_04275 [Chlamydiae bacterium RIFCSPHIGHO2_12_FULL_27_8]